MGNIRQTPSPGWPVFAQQLSRANLRAIIKRSCRTGCDETFPTMPAEKNCRVLIMKICWHNVRRAAWHSPISTPLITLTFFTDYFVNVLNFEACRVLSWHCWPISVSQRICRRCHSKVYSESACRHRYQRLEVNEMLTASALHFLNSDETFSAIADIRNFPLAQLSTGTLRSCPLETLNARHFAYWKSFGYFHARSELFMKPILHSANKSRQHDTQWKLRVIKTNYN